MVSRIDADPSTHRFTYYLISNFRRELEEWLLSIRLFTFFSFSSSFAEAEEDSGES